MTTLWLMPFQASPRRDGGAKQRGLRLLIDLVVNPTSDQHAWFKSARSDPHSRHRDWYVWSRRKPADSLKIMGFWIQLGVDGFRMDAVPFFIGSEGASIILAEANVQPDEHHTHAQGSAGDRLGRLRSHRYRNAGGARIALRLGNNSVLTLHNFSGEPLEVRFDADAGERGNLLVNLLAEDHSRAGQDGRHCVLLEAPTAIAGIASEASTICSCTEVDAHP